MITSIELGILYAIMALGVYLTFRVLEFADLTVDGSFTTGAAVAAVGITSGVPPLLATLAAILAGMTAGLITGLLHTKGNIDGLLAGILTQIALYSINLRIMGRANIQLLREEHLLSPLRERGILGSWLGPLTLLPIALIVLVLLVSFLHTEVGLAMRATGDNPTMIRSFGVSTDAQKIIGLALSNGMVGLAGALVAQYQGFADVGIGIGMIVAGLASVIIGQALLGRTTIWRAALAAVIGAVLYRMVIQIALLAGLNPNDMKLISAILVILALVIPQWKGFSRLRLRWRSKHNGDAVTAATMESATSEEDPLKRIPDDDKDALAPEPSDFARVAEADYATDPLAGTGAERKESE